MSYIQVNCQVKLSSLSVLLLDRHSRNLASLNGASSQASQRIASSKDPEATSKKAIAAFKQLLEGLRKSPDRTIG
ncbi:hypothetical protein P9236_04105 [Mesorhizobium sp. WSM4884]|nr:hypothetical protein [Mesorhizobium sp. WSM4884]MDG4880528.1 hypothetical protein [Mesorhizobium sp. WSM4884]